VGSLRVSVARPHPGAVDRVWWAVLIGLCAVLAAPLFVIDVPPLLDYPNHLARAFVLASLPDDTVLARFYAPHWSIIPNLALDIIAPPLIKVLPVHVVGRLLIAAAVLLPALGVIAYNTALGGRWWPLGVGLIAYNICLLYGFLNFEIALGLALLLAAGWLRWREDRPALAVVAATLGAPLLFACHLMGVVFFGLLIGGAELFRLCQERTISSAVRRGALLALVFAAPAILYGFSALRQLGGDAEFLSASDKLFQLLITFFAYNRPLDLASACVAIALPAVCLVLRRGKVPGPAAVPMVLLLLVFLAAPNAWKSTYALDTRFGIMLGFMLFAGFVPERWPPGFGRVVSTALVVLFAARMAVLTTAWAAHRTDIADLRTVLAPVQPGQAVYVAQAGLAEAPAYWNANPGWRLLSNNGRMDEHLGALVLIERRAFWPFEFDMPSQQPIETREPYKSLAEHVGHLPNRADAAMADVCGFDYVLLMEADAVPDLPADRFRLLIRSGFAALYTITRCNG
jgi:hypothetical protein